MYDIFSFLSGQGRHMFFSGAALQRCSCKKVFWKNVANLRKCDFNKVVKQLSEIMLRHGYSALNYCIFSEHLFLRISLAGCFFNSILSAKAMRILRWNGVLLLNFLLSIIISLNKTPLKSFKRYFQHYRYLTNTWSHFHMWSLVNWLKQETQ